MYRTGWQQTGSADLTANEREEIAVVTAEAEALWRSVASTSQHLEHI